MGEEAEAADVCECGHLEQAHDDGDEIGKCHAPFCDCDGFVSEDGINVVEEAA